MLAFLLAGTVTFALRYAIPALVVIWLFGVGSVAWWLLCAVGAVDYAYNLYANRHLLRR